MFSHLKDHCPFQNTMTTLFTRKEQLLSWFTIMFLTLNSLNSSIQIIYLFFFVSIYRIDPKWLTKAYKYHRITYVILSFIILSNSISIMAFSNDLHAINNQILDFIKYLGYLVISARMDYLFGKHIEHVNDPTDRLISLTE
eukprot:NODE_583_length_5729_cov_0.479574.p7 type:complete len:141 gc:universal NODE_583_length_5729_cov_0.479574:3377-3799(+)